MATQHSSAAAAWQDLRWYLADIITSEAYHAKVMTSLLTLCASLSLSSLLKSSVFQRTHLPSPALARLKLYVCIISVAVEILSLVSWLALPSFHAVVSLQVISIDFLFTCATGFVIDLATKRPYSWLPGSFYLSLRGINRLFKCQCYYEACGLGFASGCMFASGCCSLVLFTSLLVPQQLVPKHIRQMASPYVSWVDEVVALAKCAFFGVFQSFEHNESVPELGSEVDPDNLSAAFSAFWEEATERSTSPLLTVCLRTVSWFLFLGVFPRLIASALLLTQPFLLKKIILFVGIGVENLETQWTLILSTFVIFFGSAVSHACYNLLSHRMHIALRGVLLYQVFQKLYRLGPNQAKSSAILTIINDDIPKICKHIQMYYQLFNDAIHIGLGVCLMWMLAGPACFLAILSLGISILIRFSMQESLSELRLEFQNATKERSMNMRNALSQLPLIKMLGLRSVVVGGLQTARRIELEYMQKHHEKACIGNMADVLVDTVTPGALCLGFSLLTPDRIMPEYVFPSLALAVHLNIALYTGMRKYVWMEQFFEALKRVEDFLLQRNFTDCRTVTELGRHAVSCVELAISPEGCEEAILSNLNFTIDKATVTICIGPSSSGKSTFLQALAGEAQITGGSLHVENAEVAYCGQDPSLENVSIRENIVAGQEFNSGRYELVLRLCLLHRDIEKLEEGDAYVVGVNGINLSGGQRHRVSLARAIFSHIETIIIDDLFGSLDRRTATSILFLLCGKENGFLRQEKRTVFLSTYLRESFDIADQVLIFDGLGTAMCRKRDNVDSEFRTKLGNLTSPHEINPEEEDHKQLAGILRSRRIRDTLNHASSQPGPLARYEPLSGICAFSYKVSSPLSTRLLMFYNSLLSVTENIIEYLNPIWVDYHADDMRFPMLFIAIGLVTILFLLFRARLISRTMLPSNLRHIDGTVFRQLFRSTVVYLGAVDQGHLLQRMESNFKLVEELQNTVSSVVYLAVHVISRSLNIISGTRAGTFLLVILGFFVYLILFYNCRANRQLHNTNVKAEEKLGRKFLEAAEGIKYVRAFGRTQHNLNDIFGLVNQSQKLYYANLCRQGSMLFFCDMHTAISLTVLVFLATRQPLASSQSGIGLSFWSSLCMSHALDCLASQFAKTENILGNAHEIEELVQNIPVEDHESGLGLPPSWPERGEVQFDRVTARYSISNASNPALHNVSISVGAGEKLAIAGRTGSGKTSILLALLGFLNYEGTIKIDDIDISTVNRDALRSAIITLTYNPLQLRETVRRNLLPFDFQYSPNGIARLDDETLRSVLLDLGIWGTLSRQGGFDAFLPNVQLSRSEMQLFGIARAIFQRMGRGGKLILMDEATSALDKATDSRVQGALTAAFPGCTFLIITHRQTTVGDAQKFLELEDGGVRSFRDTQRIRDTEASATQVSYNQFAESAGGGTLPENAAA